MLRYLYSHIYFFVVIIWSYVGQIVISTDYQFIMLQVKRSSIALSIELIEYLYNPNEENGKKFRFLKLGSL